MFTTEFNQPTAHIVVKSNLDYEARNISEQIKKYIESKSGNSFVSLPYVEFSNGKYTYKSEVVSLELELEEVNDLYNEAKNCLEPVPLCNIDSYFTGTQISDFGDSFDFHPTGDGYEWVKSKDGEILERWESGTASLHGMAELKYINPSHFSQFLLDWYHIELKISRQFFNLSLAYDNALIRLAYEDFCGYGVDIETNLLEFSEELCLKFFIEFYNSIEDFREMGNNLCLCSHGYLYLENEAMEAWIEKKTGFNLDVPKFDKENFKIY